MVKKPLDIYLIFKKPNTTPPANITSEQQRSPNQPKRKPTNQNQPNNPPEPKPQTPLAR